MEKKGFSAENGVSSQVPREAPNTTNDTANRLDMFCMSDMSPSSNFPSFSAPSKYYKLS